MEGRNNLFWKVLFSLLIMAVYGSCSAAYAAEFGGFEVSTGTGEYEGTGEEWEDEPVCNTPEQNDSKNNCSCPFYHSFHVSPFPVSRSFLAATLITNLQPDF